MFISVRKNEFSNVMSLMNRKLPIYLIATLIESIVMSVCLNIVLAFISKAAFNAAISGDMAFIKKSIVMAGISFLTGASLVPIFQYIANRCARRTMVEIQSKIFKHLCDSKIENFEEYHSGDLVSRVTNDLQSIEKFYLSHMQNLIFACVFGLISMASIFVLEWHMGIIILILGIITIIINKKFAFSTRNVSDIIQKNSGKLNERLIDIIQGSPVTKIFGIENTIHHFYTEKNDEMSKDILNRYCINAKFSIINILFSYFNVVGLFCLGIFMSMKGFMNISTIIAIILLQGNASYTFNNINNIIIDMQKSLSCVSRVMELMKIPVEEKDEEKPYTTDYENIMLKLKDVCFSYKNDEERNSIKNINISVNRGQTAAIIGHSGSGKSTIIKLILKFYHFKSGGILIDGKKINQYSLAELRDMIAYVPQNAYLFNGTIEENIDYGKIGSTKDEIIEAAKKANAHDFIMELPQGYETMISEGGENLSGGQRQRISIARAILKNAPLLLLDEATSALDSESEELVQNAINTLMKNKTTIIVAHKLSSIKNTNVIYAMEDGKIVESGCHKDLIEKEGLYKRLYEFQFSNEDIN